MPTNNGRITAPVSLADVSKAIGVNSTDLGTLCGSERINMWAKNKPIRKSSPVPITDDDRHIWMYGLRKNEDGYFVYEQPRGEDYNEWFRITDFNNYNHNAECPVKDFSTLFDRTINIRTKNFLIDSDNFFNRGANVELPLSLFPALNTLTSYIGLLFIKRGTDDGVYFTNGTRVEDACTKPETQAGHVSLAELVSWELGDIIDVYLCCAMQPWVSGDTNIPITLQRMDVTATNGHTWFIVDGFSLDRVLFPHSVGSFNPNFYDDVMVNYSMNSDGSYSFRRVACRLNCDYEFGNTENIAVTFEASIESSSTYSRSVHLGPANVTNGKIEEDVAYCDMNYTISASDFRDLNGMIYVYFYIRTSGRRKLLCQLLYPIPISGMVRVIRANVYV